MDDGTNKDDEQQAAPAGGDMGAAPAPEGGDMGAAPAPEGGDEEKPAEGDAPAV